MSITGAIMSITSALIVIVLLIIVITRVGNSECCRLDCRGLDHAEFSFHEFQAEIPRLPESARQMTGLQGRFSIKGGFPKVGVLFWGGPQNKDYSILEFIFGSPYLG